MADFSGPLEKYNRGRYKIGKEKLRNTGRTIKYI